MVYPTKDQIIDAIEKRSNILPPSLNGYECIMGRFGALSYLGGRCLVFKVTKKEKALALRVWYTEVDSVKNRMKDLAEFFSGKSLSFVVPFQFFEKGLRVPTNDGIVLLDIMVMDWVDGDNLKDYIRKVVHSGLSKTLIKQRLLVLSEHIARLFDSMHHLGISHGDLQHTNIIVLSNGEPVLIDYDSFFYPGTKYCRHTTIGYDEYQHPLRRMSLVANRKTDFFSELIIYLAIQAYAEDSSLWDRYSINTLDNSILFTAKDFLDIDHSPLYNELISMHGNIAILCRLLKDYLHCNSIDELEPFLSFIPLSFEGMNKSLYCVICGRKHNYNDNYCIFCGARRL